MRIVILFFVVAICFSTTFGQIKLNKVFSPDNSTISKKITQKRIITEYFDGGAFRCGSLNRKGECDIKKFREIIWQCWNEKTLCYLKMTGQGVDMSSVEHIFIEPNKENQWTIVRRNEIFHFVPELRKPLHNLPLAYSVDWKEKDGEKVLLLKNKFGKVIDEY